MEVYHWCVVVHLRGTVFNELLSKFDIKFVSSKLNKLLGNVFVDCNWVLFLLKEILFHMNKWNCSGDNDDDWTWWTI